jgi:WD40 repeat protein
VRQIPNQPSTTKHSATNNNYLDTEENPQQIISDIEPSIDNTISNLVQKAILVDMQPIRTACFSPRGDHIALGTNSKSLKICALPSLHDEDDEDLSPNMRSDEQGKSHQINIIFEQQNHHNGSLYCVDWSRTSRLIASGSNDKTIKLLVCPDFD